MKKLTVIIFLFLLYSYNTTRCMELALVPQQEPKQKIFEKNALLILKIALECPIPFLNMMSRVNLAKTCKVWHNIINPTKMWYENVHPGFLDKEDCRKLNLTCYTHAMIYYARKNDSDMVSFIYGNSPCMGNKDDTELVCEFLQQNILAAYANKSHDNVIEEKMKSYMKGFLYVPWIKMKFTIHLFLLQGMDVNKIFSPDKVTLLHLTAGEKTEYLPVGQIINHPKINVNIQDEYGKTALHYAIATNSPYHSDTEKIEVDKKRLSIAQVLLARADTNPNIQDNNGTTPLMSAIMAAKNNVIKSLLKNKQTNLNLKDKKGYTALDYAIHYKDEKFVKLLRSKGGISGSFLQKYKNEILIGFIGAFGSLIIISIFDYFYPPITTK